MTTTTTNGASALVNDKGEAVLSDKHYTDLCSAFEICRKILSAHTGKDCSELTTQDVLSTANGLRRARVRAQKNARNADTRAKLFPKLAEIKAAHMKVRNTFTPEQRAMLAGVLPDHVAVSVSDLLSCFPANTTEANARIILQDLGVSMQRGASKDGPKVRIELTDAPKPPTASA
jgi:hypothetical protein